MNGEFQLTTSDSVFARELEVERINSGEDGEEDEYELRICNLECDCPAVTYRFKDEAQVKEFLTRFNILVTGLDVEQVTKRIQRLETENAKLHADIENIR